MKIEIGKHDRMAESGSSLLRLIQNQDIPLLDLLIRESLQNSLDAAAQGSSSVNIDIVSGNFISKDLNKHLEKVESSLNRRYGNSKGRFIAIRDSETTGLTGPVRYKEVKKNDFGNLLKLVYEISKPQIHEGAGGSWGLGKTIFFRLGIGLVIYYSRIRKGRTYESRLAACLVEDETRDDALIPQTLGVKRGIAWWGKRDGVGSDVTVPVDNESEIKKILSVFSIEPYKQKETGTTIIIPYIKDTALLNEVYATNEDQSLRPYWANDVAEYLKVAVQRWYAPRLLNPHYPYGAWLSVSVNGEQLKVSDMLSVFKCIREMYILAQDSQLDEDSFLLSGQVDYKVVSIDLRKVLGTTSAGRFVFAKYSRKQLAMDPPDNEKNPFIQITNSSELAGDDHGPIIMFTRRPGMIVGYDYNGQWTRRMPRTNEDEYILGLFVLNSQNTLQNIKDPVTGKPVSLEEYIRKGEKADHASWTDRNIRGINPRIVDNVQKHIIKKVKDEYSEISAEPVIKQNIGLGHALADLLLPPDDFGKASSEGSSSSGESGRETVRRKKAVLRILSNPIYSNNSQQLEYEIVLKTKPCVLELVVLSDYRSLSADIWEGDDELGKPFPLVFLNFTVSSIHEGGKKGRPVSVRYSLNRYETKFNTDMVDVSLLSSEKYAKRASLRLVPHVACTIKGSLSFGYDDNRIRCGLELKEEGT